MIKHQVFFFIFFFSSMHAMNDQHACLEKQFTENKDHFFKLIEKDITNDQLLNGFTSYFFMLDTFLPGLCDTRPMMQEIKNLRKGFSENKRKDLITLAQSFPIIGRVDGKVVLFDKEKIAVFVPKKS